MSDKLVARIREMRKLLRQVEPKLTGSLRRKVRSVLVSADKCTPPDNRIGKQLKFTQQTVMQAVDTCSGNKTEAAKLLGCSLRTVYTVLKRGDPKPKRSKQKAFSVDEGAVTECVSQMVDAARLVIPKLRGRQRKLLADAVARCEDRLPSERQPKFSAAKVRAMVEQCGGDKNEAAKRLGCSLSSIYAMLRRKDS